MGGIFYKTRKKTDSSGRVVVLEPGWIGEGKGKMQSALREEERVPN